MSSITHSSNRRGGPVAIRLWIAATVTLFVVGTAISLPYVEAAVGERMAAIVTWVLLGLWVVSFLWVLAGLDRETVPTATSADLDVPEPRQPAGPVAAAVSTVAERRDLDLRARRHAARCVAAAWAGCEVMSADLQAAHPSAVTVSTPRWTGSDAAFAQIVSLVAGHVIAAEGGDQDAAAAEIRDVVERVTAILANGQAPTAYRGALTSDALVATARGTAQDALRFFPDVVDSIASSLAEAGWMGGDQLQLLLWPVIEARPDGAGKVWADA